MLVEFYLVTLIMHGEIIACDIFYDLYSLAEIIRCQIWIKIFTVAASLTLPPEKKEIPEAARLTEPHLQTATCVDRLWK